jgi:hypothetical protein
VWAVGAYGPDGGEQPLTMRWTGSAWNIVTSPTLPAGSAFLVSVSVVAPGEVWATGYNNNLPNNRSETITMRYGPPCATPTAIATATAGPGAPSHTPVTQPTYTPGGPTVTVTPEPTACAVEFIDVPPDSTFYDFVRCMACRGIINGYPDGTFKPNNNVTRGQLSKIVSNSAGFSDPQTVQMFQDVPIGSTFFDYIGRLASRGFISGYPCGGAGEPCGPASLPYFRPGSSATRGQISKIVSNAAGILDPPGTQIFEDVAPASTFYDFVQRLANRGVMSGYICGTTGEPCVPPENRQYFRPNNNATRGQTSKIVANTFFPNCQTPGRVRK